MKLQVLTVLPNACNYQLFDRSMLCPAQVGSEGCSPKIDAGEVSDEEEGEICLVH